MSTDTSDQPDAPDTRQTPKSRPDQAMKAATAAKKLNIYLPATPQEFQDGPVTREQLVELQSNPPAWLEELRLTGPFPRQEVARKLGVTTSGLTRGGIGNEPLTTDEIQALLTDMPSWLSQERHNLAQVREEEIFLKARNAERAAKRAAEEG
jgi:hypothetical protein